MPGVQYHSTPAFKNVLFLLQFVYGFQKENESVEAEAKQHNGIAEVERELKQELMRHLVIALRDVVQRLREVPRPILGDRSEDKVSSEAWNYGAGAHDVPAGSDQALQRERGGRRRRGRKARAASAKIKGQ